MPTKEEIIQTRNDRAAFLNAVWDQQQATGRAVLVAAALDAANLRLPQHSIDFLVNTLIQDRLLRDVGGMSIAEASPTLVAMTASGRDEVVSAHVIPQV